MIVWDDQLGEYVQVETPLHLRVRRPYLVTVIDVLQATTREVRVVDATPEEALLTAATMIEPTEQTLGTSYVRKG